MRAMLILWTILCGCDGSSETTLTPPPFGSEGSEDCDGEGRLMVDVVDQSGASAAPDAVSATAEDGTDLEVDDYDEGQWLIEGEPGTWTVRVEACAGAQVIEGPVDVGPTDSCEDGFEFDEHTVVLDPC